MAKDFKIAYGPLMQPILEQLAAQGLGTKDAEVLEKQRHAINVLYIPGLMSESEHGKILGRLHKKICKTVYEIEEDNEDS